MRENEAWAEWIAWQLREAGWQVDVQAWHSVPGTNVVAWLDRCLARADHVLLVLSAAFLRSAGAGAEWQTRFEPGERTLIPIRVELCAPPGLLSPLVRIDLFDVDELDARRALLRGLRGALDGHLVPAGQPPFPLGSGPPGEVSDLGEVSQLAQPGQPRVGAEPEAPGEAAGPPGPEFPGLERPESFVGWVRDACADRYPGASVVLQPAVETRVGERAVSLLHLEVTGERDGERGVWPVGLCPGRPDRALVSAFHRLIHARYEARDRYVESDLVYGAGFAEPEVRRWARRQGIRLSSLAEFEGRWDPQGYVLRQTRRLTADPSYPPELYVPQRYVLLDDPPGTRPTDDVFTAMVDWLDVESARMLLVLGEFGHGKSFLLHELARVLPVELPKVVPMLVELRALEKSHHVDHLLALHLAKVGEPDANVSAVRRMLDRGRVVLLFDGFDELAQRVTFDRAAEHLGMILDAVSGRAKIVLTSRTQHFASDDQWRTAFGERVRQLAGSKLIRLADFDESQIREYLVRLSTRAEEAGAGPGGAARGGAGQGAGFNAAERQQRAERRERAERRADARLRLIHDIRDLLGLSANPRMLSFIAELPERDLLAARSPDGTISSADLYATLIERWLRFEADRRRPTRGSHQSLDRYQLRAAVDALAVALWDSGGEAIALSELTATVGAALTDLSAAYLSAAEAAFAVGSGSLLRRGDDDRFSFAHRSVMEYLVAVAAARQLAAGGDGAGELLERREMSELMVDFLAGTADYASLRTWAGAALTRYEEWTADGARLGVDWELPLPARVLGDLHVTRDNALALSRRLGFQLGALQLAGQDLRRRDLSGQNLRYAGLAGANLAGLRLHDVDLTGADLTGADLREAWLVRPVLTGARLIGSHWDRAVLIDPVLDGGVLDCDELAGAVVSGRDRPRPVIRPATAQGAGAVFSPDTSLLAVAIGAAVQLVVVAELVELDVLHHAAGVRAMAFLADDRLATVGWDDEVRIWAVESGEVTVSWRIKPGAGRAVAFCADGSRLATIGIDDWLRIWEVAAARPMAGWEVEPDMGHDLVFSADATLLASRDASGWTRVWDAAAGRLVAEWIAHLGAEHTSAFLDGGKRVATAGLDGWLRVWDTVSGRILAERRVEPDGCAEVVLSADGVLLATVGIDGSLRVWSVPGSDPTSPTDVPPLALDPVATRPGSHPVFLPSGEHLAMVHGSGSLAIRDVSSGRLLAASRVHTAAVAGRSTAFAADARVIVSCTGRATGGTLGVHHMASGRQIAGHETTSVRNPDIGAGTWLAALSADGSLAALGGLRGQRAVDEISVVRILPADWAAQPWTHSLPPLKALVTARIAGGATAAALTPDGRVLAVGSSRGKVDFVNIDHPAARAATPESAAYWTAAHWIAADMSGADSSGSVPATNGREPSFPLRSLAFSLSGTRMAGVGAEGLRIWQVAPTPWKLFVEVAAIDLAAVTFSPTGRLVAAGGSGVGMWASETGFGFMVDELTDGSAAALAFAPDGRLLAAGGQRHGQGRIWLWEVSSRRLVAELVSESGPVVDLVFAPDGRMLAATGADHTIRYWDVAERALAATAVLFGDGGRAVLLPDGEYLVAGRAQGALWWTAKLRRFGPDELDGLMPAAAKFDPDRPIQALAHFPALAADPDPEPPVQRPRRRLFGRRHP